jgi:hypothetical protein
MRILGLELPDCGLFLGTFATCLVGAMMLSAWVLFVPPFLLLAALLKMRKGRKPAGYLRYLAYKSGAILIIRWILPEILAAPYMVAPVWAFRNSKTIFLSAHPLPNESDSSAVKFFLNRSQRRWRRHDPRLAEMLLRHSQGGLAHAST